MINTSGATGTPPSSVCAMPMNDSGRLLNGRARVRISIPPVIKLAVASVTMKLLR